MHLSLIPEARLSSLFPLLVATLCSRRRPRLPPFNNARLAPPSSPLPPPLHPPPSPFLFSSSSSPASSPSPPSLPPASRGMPRTPAFSLSRPPPRFISSTSASRGMSRTAYALLPSGMVTSSCTFSKSSSDSRTLQRAPGKGAGEEVVAVKEERLMTLQAGSLQTHYARAPDPCKSSYMRACIVPR